MCVYQKQNNIKVHFCSKNNDSNYSNYSIFWNNLELSGILFHSQNNHVIFGFFHFWPSCACVLLLLLSKQWSVGFLFERVDFVVYRFSRIVLLFLFQLFFVFLLHVLRILLPNFLTTDSTILLFGLYSTPILLSYFWYSFSKNKLNS